MPIGRCAVIDYVVGACSLELVGLVIARRGRVTRAPKAFANCTANNETPPDPNARTVSPAWRLRAPVRAFQAVTAAQGNVAASSNERWSRIRTSASSLRTINSVIMPSTDPPSCGAYSQSMRPAIQRGNMAAATLSPIATRVTPEPIATTSPAPPAPMTTSCFTAAYTCLVEPTALGNSVNYHVLLAGLR